MLHLPLASAGSLVDNSTENFALGVHENTENIANRIRLKSGYTSGQFTSQIFDAGVWAHWETMNWVENEPFLLIQENDDVGAEPETLADGSLRRGEILGGSITDVRVLDGVYENIGENTEDNCLNWEHKIENITFGFENYVLKIRGYTGGDYENVGIYIWENQGATWGWRFIDNLTSTEKTIEWTIPRTSIENYLVSGDILIRYFENNTDATQTWVVVDLCILSGENRIFSEVKIQVRVSSDNVVWTGWAGPSGDDTTFFTSSPANLTPILDRRYIQYRVYFTSPSPSLSGGDGPTFGEVVINYSPVSPPSLQSPSNGSWTNDNTPTFDWSDVEDATEYHLLVDNDSNFSSPEINVLVASSQFTSATELPDATYYWKVRAKVGSDLSTAFSAPWTVNIATAPPTPPSLISPDNDVTLFVDQPLFRWTISTGVGAITYWLVIDNDQDFSSPIYNKTGISENSHVIENTLPENFNPYYWKVAAVDNIGNLSWSEWRKFELKVFPSSVVGQISPYWQTAPVSISVTASDNDGTIENVELWYRYSVDNSEWGPWTFYENRSSPPYSFTFNFPNGQGLYEFYSIAWDSRGNRENTPPTPDTACGFDNAAPPAPTLIQPENDAVIETRKPTFRWTSVTDLSGVTYNLIVDNENTLAPPHIYFKTGITENSHTTENSLDIGVYWWKIVARDAVGNENSENVFIFTLRLWNNVERWSGVIKTISGWMTAEVWSVTINAPYGVYGYLLVEEWSAVVNAPPPVFTIVESWTTTVASEISEWKVVESWTASIGSGGGWMLAESWMSTVTALPHIGWSQVETWSFTAVTLARWELVEGWNASITAAAYLGWPQVEMWSVTVDALPYVEWVQAEIWAETLTTSAQWFVCESFAADIVANVVSGWTFVETWTPTLTSVVLSGWTLDESWIATITAEILQPVLLLPLDGENTNNTNPTFDWEDNTLPIDNFEIQIDDDQDFSPPLVRWENTGATSQYSPGFLPDNLYWWRVRMWRGGVPGAWAQRTVRVDTLPPEKPSLRSPLDGENENDSAPNLRWSAPPENSFPLTYFVQISNSKYFEPENIATSAWVMEENWEVPPVLQENVWYWWRVLVKDNAGNTGDYSSARKFKIDTIAPPPPTVIWPENDGWTTTLPNLDWAPVVENSLPVVYFGEISLFPDFSGSPLRTISTLDDNWSVSPELSEGTYFWRLKVRDNAGNLGSWS
ncbi:MAG: Ig-like domain-containing protein, partial [Candidatus Hadarchaeales archaeon]